MSEERWVSLVLAAGKGTRMRSDLAKVLHEIEGRTLLAHVLETGARLPLQRVIAVIGHQAEEVRRRHTAYLLECVLQEPQLGTGHAVQVASPLLQNEPEGTGLLVLYGDVPLLRESTLRELMERHTLQGNSATILTARVADPKGYGRILRDDLGAFVRIVEDRDLAPHERSITEINSGIYTFHLKSLLGVLARLGRDNAQREYYLTDALRLILEDGGRVGVFCIEDEEEIAGINTVEQLAEAETILARRRDEGSEVCPICRLLREGDDAVLLRENGLAVLLPKEPYNAGHLLVVPERHIVSYSSLGPEEAEAYLALGQRAERWCDEAYHPQAMNLGHNSGRPGEHLALHVIPRWAGDANFMPLIGGVNISPETPEGTRRRIRAVQARLEGSA
jgi:UDP-N-acetylglucosamine pyrophosphorylase